MYALGIKLRRKVCHGRRPKKILYAEDNADIAKVCLMTLEKLGKFEVLHCPDGFDALENFPKFSPQLLLLDVMMPGMDGPETLQKIRTLPNGEHVPAIFITAKAQNSEQEEYMTFDGVVGVIVKPFNPMTLCDEMRTLWGKT